MRYIQIKIVEVIYMQFHFFFYNNNTTTTTIADNSFILLLKMKWNYETCSLVIGIIYIVGNIYGFIMTTASVISLTNAFIIYKEIKIF